MFTDSTLMSPDFDEEAYLRFALHASNCQVEQARLALCAKTVREGLHKILSENVEDMVQQVTASCRVQRDVSAVRQGTSLLLHSFSRLRHTIQEPYRVINESIIKLQNTNTTLNTLRSVLKFVGLTTRLKSQLPGDLAHSARTLRELEELLRTSNIKGIEVVEARIDVVERAAVTIRTKAQDMLRKGDAQDASGVAVSLQCFFTLQSLHRVLNSLMTEQKREVMKSLMRDLDLQAITTEINREGNSGGNTSNASMRTHDVLFLHLQTAFTNTIRHTQVIVAVWRVLVKKVDPVTHRSYLSAVENPMSMLGDYWHLLTDKLCERLKAVQKQPGFIAALAGDVLQYRTLLNTFLENMRELLELLNRLEVDAAAPRQMGRPSSPTSTFSNGVEELKRGWLLKVMQDVEERFTMQITDRHREQMHNITSKLHSITSTANNRPVPNAVVDLQQPRLPSVARALDTQGYTMLATQDVLAYRQDPHTLSIVLDCIFRSLSVFVQHIMETKDKWPLPPLPSVSGDVNGLQMLHICMSNACTFLSNDLEAILASLPEDADADERAKSFSTPYLTEVGLSGVNKASKTMKELGDRGISVPNAGKSVLDGRYQLRGLSNRLKSFSETTVRAFFLSVSMLLLDTVSMCVDGPHGQETVGVTQLQIQMQHFMSHYYYLFETHTSTLDDNARRLTDILLARLMIMVALVSPFTSGVEQHILGCLHHLSHVVLSFGPASGHGLMGRSTVLLKGQLHQLTVWYGLSEGISEKAVGEWYDVLLTLPPIMARLLLLQRVLRPSPTLRKPHTTMGVTTKCFLEVLETAMLNQSSVNDTPKRNSFDGGSTGISIKTDNNNIPAAMRIGEAMKAVETCFLEATTVLQCDDDDKELGVMLQWAKELWELLQGRQS